MPQIRAIATTLTALLMAACGGDGGTEEETPAFFVGRLSSDAAPALVGSNEYLTGWLISYVPDQAEIYLSTRTASFSEQGRDRWALTLRVPVGQATGTKGTQAVGLRLFSNYRNDCCLNREDPFGASETYDKVYAAVDGTVTFQSEKEGTFAVTVQEESMVRSGNFIGPAFQLRGCWKIAGERGSSGCSLAP